MSSSRMVAELETLRRQRISDMLAGYKDCPRIRLRVGKWRVEWSALFLGVFLASVTATCATLAGTYPALVALGIPCGPLGLVALFTSVHPPQTFYVGGLNSSALETWLGSNCSVDQMQEAIESAYARELKFKLERAHSDDITTLLEAGDA